MAAAFVNSNLKSVHFWGEKPNGQWILQIENSNQEAAVLVEAQLIIYGSGHSG
jgi:subtilisin-like proprotein convertase family protein